MKQVTCFVKTQVVVYSFLGLDVRSLSCTLIQKVYKFHDHVCRFPYGRGLNWMERILLLNGKYIHRKKNIYLFWHCNSYHRLWHGYSLQTGRLLKEFYPSFSFRYILEYSINKIVKLERDYHFPCDLFELDFDVLGIDSGRVKQR